MAQAVTSAFVTGGTSAIGALVLADLASDHRVVALEHEHLVDSATATVVQGGLESVEDHRDTIRAADVVVHLAGLSRARDPGEYWRVNVELTDRLVAVARPGQSFVYVSTRAIDPAGGAYGRSKLEAERRVRASGLDWLVIRPGEVYGSSGSEGIDGLLARALSRRVLLDVRARPPVSYAPVSVVECARAIANAARSTLSEQVLVVAAPTPWTASDIQRAFRAAGRRVVLLPVPAGVLRRMAASSVPTPFVPDQVERLIAPKSLGDPDRLKELGISPVPFDEAIESMVSDLR
jgi:nucleoside-diphosphate-sugar epimerase